ncbi:hypothetical protein Q3C01_44265 [Bradyrhizobium sp. UFLA05-109]
MSIELEGPDSGCCQVSRVQPDVDDGGWNVAVAEQVWTILGGGNCNPESELIAAIDSAAIVLTTPAAAAALGSAGFCIDDETTSTIGVQCCAGGQGERDLASQALCQSRAVGGGCDRDCRQRQTSIIAAIVFGSHVALARELTEKRPHAPQGR